MDFQRFLNAFLLVFRTMLAWHIPFTWGSFSMDFYPFYWLMYALNGEKYKDSRCNIGYRKSTSVNFGINFDFNTLPEDLKKITVEPKKNEIKAAIKDGLQIDGVTLEETNNLIVQ